MICALQSSGESNIGCEAGQMASMFCRCLQSSEFLLGWKPCPSALAEQERHRKQRLLLTSNPTQVVTKALGKQRRRKKHCWGQRNFNHLLTLGPAPLYLHRVSASEIRLELAAMIFLDGRWRCYPQHSTLKLSPRGSLASFCFDNS